MATDSGDDVGVKATADDSQASDNDNAERPVRHKLKETSITSAPNASTTGASTEQQQDGENSRSSSRGRKRSFDEDQPENLDEENGHRRKRSRDSKAEEDENITSLNAPEAEGEQTQTTDIARKILSPKKKRSRDQLDKDEPKAESTVEDNKTSAENGASTTTAGEPEKKRHRDASQERGSAPLKSAFANTSAVSPFGSLGASKPKEETSKPVATSSSAFAASSLAAFASSEQSPFGAIGGSNTSVFKSATTTEATKPAATGFAGAASTSGFASLGSGFSGFSGGFGAAGLKGGLTSFAAPGGAGILGSSSKSKPFGAEEDEEEEEKEKEKEADTAPGEFEEDKTDERFFERPREEGEKTYFSSKAKLFQFSNGEWKERGIGTFKVNVKATDGKEDKKAARLIMRADGVLRVMLNTPLFKGMKVGDASGNEPKSKQIHLASLEEGRSVPTLLRVSYICTC
ncbi:unnamed protein product [Aspergillus oryzae]|uniref:Unnamed protein product n=2 Tax=Aspergillus oryzae TaxID=5062 RepID=A0AAN4YYW7_ASPOZ|nr:unnamed protein product [Aspergillus oryzae]GMF89573.1 unnamed protein product [Aspergillus oryzae]GMG10083.1 unnamed protein product [Aspergillus oryzae]GMG38608.1 unnamed protein product [Aspergillus oryzae]GMG50250.1 unnamed protein product [Aspergillus oryzae var. brunneus]